MKHLSVESSMDETHKLAGKQATVLVVDDNVVVRKLLSGLLVRSGYSAIEASDGAAALAAVGQTAIDLVLLDVMMPEIDGLQVCRRLKGDPATAHIPVVMVTARGGQDARRRSCEAGADAVLQKPVETADLVQTIQRLL